MAELLCRTPRSVARYVAMPNLVWRQRSAYGTAMGRVTGRARRFIVDAGRYGHFLLRSRPAGDGLELRTPGVVRIERRRVRSRPQKANLGKSGAMIQARSIQSRTHTDSRSPRPRSAVATSSWCLPWTCGANQNTLDLQARTVQVRPVQCPTVTRNPCEKGSYRPQIPVTS